MDNKAETLQEHWERMQDAVRDIPNSFSLGWNDYLGYELRLFCELQIDFERVVEKASDAALLRSVSGVLGTVNAYVHAPSALSSIRMKDAFEALRYDAIAFIADASTHRQRLLEETEQVTYFRLWSMHNMLDNYERDLPARITKLMAGIYTKELDHYKEASQKSARLWLAFAVMALAAALILAAWSAGLVFDGPVDEVEEVAGRIWFSIIVGGVGTWSARQFSLHRSQSHAYRDAQARLSVARALSGEATDLDSVLGKTLTTMLTKEIAASGIGSNKSESIELLKVIQNAAPRGDNVA